MSFKYLPLEIEAKWRKNWCKLDLYKTKAPAEGQKCFYALSMFPYPSGTLHMGHVRNYVITDVIARMQRMKGCAVLHPMGWDAFGLPAENAAMERGINPGEWTKKNIIQMKSQLERLGLSIDWEREVTTCSPDYYKWTQYIFKRLFRHGLAYQKKALVNWDPIDKTVLANEQVNAEGKSWRSGAIVQKKELKQWFLKITDYAEELLDGLNGLEGWPEKVKTMQSNWIGKSTGAEFTFVIPGHKDININIFTTRPDTIYGVSYLALAAGNNIIDKIVDRKYLNKITDFRTKIMSINNNDRSTLQQKPAGIDIGLKAINPANGCLVPIWIADYVLEGYGSGAVMGVPGHDERDYKFAKEFGLPIKYVIKDTSCLGQNIEGAYIGDGILIESKEFTGLESKIAKNKIIVKSIKEGWGKEKIQYRLRDWLISRQRYWGCPIPIIHCKNCGTIEVPDDHLPVELPKESSELISGCLPLEQNKEWQDTKCPICKQKAQRESDTMDTFMCSSWYYLRYTDPNNSSNALNKNEVNKWLPVDHYVGGIEHAILHLLYSRFLTRSLFNIGLIGTREPFDKLLTQGMVQNTTYRNSTTGKYIDIKNILDPDHPKDPKTGEPLEIVYEKMSKSKYNGVDPSLVIDKYGADTARMFILFKAPPEKDLEWNDDDVEGQYRFIQRLWKLYNSFAEKHISTSQSTESHLLEIPDIEHITENERQLRMDLHLAIKAITDDLEEKPQFNTAISELMKLSNSITNYIDETNHVIATEVFSVFTRLLAPFAPHIAEEFWEKIGGLTSVHSQSWPTYDEAAIKTNNYKLIIQVNGKVRGSINVPNNTDRNSIEQLALNDQTSIKWLDGKSPKRIIVVPGKLVNLVI